MSSIFTGNNKGLTVSLGWSHMNHAQHLRCPNCEKSGGLKFYPDSLDVQQAACNLCGHHVPVHWGIPDFAEHIKIDDPKLSRAQRVMNSRLFAFIYETPIWRPLHTWIGSGISMEREVEEVIRMSGGGTAEMVVDLACGTGHYARAFARKVPKAKVYGLDISLGMLIHGHRTAQKKGLSTIRFMRGDIHSLPFSDNSMNQVNCGGALHLFPRLEPIWNEVARVLRPGGVFTAMTLRHVDGLIGAVQRRMAERGKGTFFVPDQLAADLRAAGFSSFKYTQHRLSLLFCAVRARVGEDY